MERIVVVRVSINVADGQADAFQTVRDPGVRSGVGVQCVGRGEEYVDVAPSPLSDCPTGQWHRSSREWIDPSSARVVRICWIVEIHEGWSAIVCGIEVVKRPVRKAAEG